MAKKKGIINKKQNMKIINKPDRDFLEIYNLINKAKLNTWYQINSNIISLYLEIGKYICGKVNTGGWGQSTVEELSNYIQKRDNSIKGFSPRNIWRMKQFYEAYKDQKVSTMLTETSWSNHLHILSKAKNTEERLFYLKLASKHRYSSRDFARIIDSSTFERAMIANKKLPTVLAELRYNKTGTFKDTYIFDFLGLPDKYKEPDLRKALIMHLKKFILELGPDFSLIGDEYLVQVGMKDYRIDLLMHNRELNCLVAIELKVTEFQPEYLGKLQFYLEALDRNVRKPHENPSIGILICKTKDEEVVKYALSRNVSPTMVAEYETKLLNKKLLKQKLHEISETFTEEEEYKN